MESVYIDVGRGGYSENVIQVGRGEYNIVENVIQVGRGGRGGIWRVFILMSIAEGIQGIQRMLFKSVAGSTILWRMLFKSVVGGVGVYGECLY